MNGEKFVSTGNLGWIFTLTANLNSWDNDNFLASPLYIFLKVIIKKYVLTLSSEWSKNFQSWSKKEKKKNNHADFPYVAYASRTWDKCQFLKINMSVALLLKNSRKITFHCMHGTILFCCFSCLYNWPFQKWCAGFLRWWSKKFIYIWKISVSLVKDVCVGRYIYYAEQ